jgi:hypothetical protein
MADTAGVNPPELRAWIEDALSRHERDARERDEDVTGSTADEIVDAIWGRLPLQIRRSASRAEVQASLTMLTLRHGIARTRWQPQPRGPQDLQQLGARQPPPD